MSLSDRDELSRLSLKDSQMNNVHLHRPLPHTVLINRLAWTAVCLLVSLDCIPLSLSHYAQFIHRYGEREPYF